MPCFFWIFLGAPYMEQIRGKRFLSGALAAITAGVVGVGGIPDDELAGVLKTFLTGGRAERTGDCYH